MPEPGDHDDNVTPAPTAGASAAMLYLSLNNGPDTGDSADLATMADRDGAQDFMETFDGAAVAAQENRGFVLRSAKMLAHLGIEQFADIGAGVPPGESLHQVVRRHQPSARVIYLDNDPVVQQHSHRFVGDCEFYLADIREPETVLDVLRAQLDFTKPIGLFINAVLHFVADDDNPQGIVATFRDALPPASYISLSHGCHEITHDPQRALDLGKEMYGQKGIFLQLRTRAAIEDLFRGMELMEPKVVPAQRWYPERPAAQLPEDHLVGSLAGLARVLPQPER
jgi:S-adenosyl methyltransferase